MGATSNLKDFFISYTGVDVEWARWIAKHLEAAGYTTIYQARDFTAGGNFVMQMHEAMQQTKRTIAVLSPEYLAARYTRSEWAEAFRRDPTGEYALLVPVRVKPCDVDGVLGARVYIDLVGLDQATAGARLVEQVRSAASKPLPPMSVLPVPGATPGVAFAAAPPQFPPPRNKKLPRGTLVVLVIALVILLGTVLALGLTGNGPLSLLGVKHQATPTSSLSPTLPPNFESYANVDDGFSINYPSDWNKQTTNVNGGKGVEFDGPGGQTVLVLNSGPGQPGSTIESDNLFCITYGVTIGATTTVTINGQQWTREECDKAGGNSHASYESVLYKGTIYILSYTAPKSTFSTNRRQYFTPMEQSFKFLM